MGGVYIFSNHWYVVNFDYKRGVLQCMWLVEENTNHGVLFFGEHLPGRRTPSGAEQYGERGSPVIRLSVFNKFQLLF